MKPQIESEIDQIIINEILKIKLENVKFESKNEIIPDNSKEIDKISKQIDRLIDLYAICGDNVEELAKKINTLKRKKNELEKVNIKPRKAVKSQIIDSLKIARDTFENGTQDDKKLIVNALIDKVTLYNDTIKIEWKFL